MFEELTALFGAITSTLSVHTKSMAVSKFFTSVGLIDNEWRDDARPRHCPLKQEFGVLIKVQSRNNFGNNSRHHPRCLPSIPTLPIPLVSLVVYQSLTYPIKPDCATRILIP